MPQWTIRMSCEYWHTVEAETKAEAEQLGSDLDTDEWDNHTWSGVEAEEEDAE